MPEPTDNPPPERSAMVLLAGGLIFTLAVAVRLPLVGQSLWYDEMYTMLNFVHQPLGKVVSGDYSPNNHILHSLACKAVNSVAVWAGALSPAEADLPPGAPPVFSEPLLRLVSVLAGSAVGLALAWPLRRTYPGVAVVLALVASLNPWLINLSTEARGYPMMLLCCIIATNCLPKRKGEIAWGYTLAMVAAVYTVPVCVPILAGHALAMWRLRRDALWTWAKAAGVALAVAALLYSPFLLGILGYYSGGQHPAVTYSRYLLELPSRMLTGEYMPGITYILLALAIVLLGGSVAWRREEFRPALISFGTMAVVGILAPLGLETYGEVRFAAWLVPLCAIPLAAVLTAPARWPVRLAQVGAAALLLASLTTSWRALREIPKQPLREGVARARELAGPNRAIIGVHLAASETARIYGNVNALAYRISSDDEDKSLPDLEAVERAIRAGHHEAWLVVPYENHLACQNPLLWQYVLTHYKLREGLAGRIDRFDIFEPRQPRLLPATHP